MTWCVWAYFLKFYMFVFDEIHVIGDKLIYGQFRVGNIWENIPKDQQRVLDEGPKAWYQDFPKQPQTTEASTASGPINALEMGFLGGDLLLGDNETLKSL